MISAELNLSLEIKVVVQFIIIAFVIFIQWLLQIFINFRWSTQKKSSLEVINIAKILIRISAFSIILIFFS
ncbi:MAG: hypothetical protein ACTSR2_05110 [Candidatus Hodarchaeales archaeon]